MTQTDDPSAPSGHPYGGEIELERAGWAELKALARELGPAERLVPGYYVDPDWSVRDVVGHIGAWLAEGKSQLERITTGTYDAHEVDIDALNALFLAAMRDQPWDLVRLQATAARHAMLAAWFGLEARSAEADWWVRKCGADHYGQHLPRLREWVAELRHRTGSSTRR
jgi:hypothetical protein